MWHVCPVCEEESIRTTCYMDGDGDGIYSRSWLASEIDEQNCKCQLTGEQINAILDENTCYE